MREKSVVKDDVLIELIENLNKNNISKEIVQASTTDKEIAGN